MPLSKRSAILLALTACIVSACAGHSLYPEVQKSLQAGNCERALQMMESGRSSYGGNAELLYLLDSAMVAIQCDDFETAQSHLHSAEALADRLWTESISRNAVSFVTNDYALAYAGEDYERVMIHLVSAIAYLQMDRFDDALVEIRRLDTLLEMFKRAAGEADDIYKTDAFGRYLSGLLHEADGAMDDAFIDYYLAAGIYLKEWQRYGTGLPSIVREDLLRTAKVVGRMDDARKQLLLGDRGDETVGSPDGSYGKIVLILFNGEGPRKISDTAVMPTRYGPVSIAFPRIVMGQTTCTGGALHLSGPNGSLSGPLMLVSDINRIAQQSLSDKQGRIVAKALARAVAKQVAIHSIANSQEKKEQKQSVAILLNFLNTIVLERADTRCWRTLPGQIEAARVYVNPGAYSVRVALCNNKIYDLGTVAVASGKTRFVFLDARYGMIHSVKASPNQKGEKP